MKLTEREIEMLKTYLRGYQEGAIYKSLVVIPKEYHKDEVLINAYTMGWEVGSRNIHIVLEMIRSSVEAGLN